MKKAFLTGEKGFIAKNLVKLSEGRLEFVNEKLQNDPNLFCNEKRELDFELADQDDLRQALLDLKCEIIIHNGAIVGTDVCGLYPQRAISANVYGTYNIATLAKKLNIPVIYIGTTVIYDTQKIQNDWIEEDSPIFPRTLYATTKYEGELIVRAYCQESKYCILRPLFCYGGEGDMNSLIAKTVFNDYSKRRAPFKIFLNPDKIKDYMHVNDFCEAIIIAAENRYILDWNTDFNISANDPIPTSEIVKIMDTFSLNTGYIKWVPETDYLGNHRVSHIKFKIATRNKWKPQIGLEEGINMVCEDMERIFSKYLYKDRNYRYPYDPFKYLDKIEDQDIDIETHYNFKG